MTALRLSMLALVLTITFAVMVGCGSGDADTTGAAAAAGDATGGAAGQGTAGIDGGGTAGSGDSGAGGAAGDGSNSSVPLAISANDWRVSSAVTDGSETLIGIDSPGVPEDATRLDVEIAGVVQALDFVSPGVFTVGGRPENESQDYRVRAINAAGAGPWSDTKSAASTRASDTRFSCPADGEVEHLLTNRPDGVGANAIINVSGGGEAEIIDWMTSVYYTRRPDPADKVAFRDVILYDPLGTALELRPGEAAQRTFDSPLGTTTVVVHGAAGMFTSPAIAATAFDADDDPVDFLFTRLHDVGRLPDGRPFVVGEVDIAHNGGDPVSVSPDPITGYTVVEDSGATLCVVARKGIVPPLAAAATALNLQRDYVRRESPYDFAAAGWDDSAPRTSAGVLIRSNFEHLSVYFDAAATGVKVRFRKKGTTAWFPARALTVDNRTLSGGVPFTYRNKGVIRYLVPGTTYEVELKDGTVYKRVEATTRARKVAKSSLVLGQVDGTLRLSRAGDVVTVTYPDDTTTTITCPAEGYAELKDGIVRGNIVLAPDTARVILTRVSVFGSAEHAVEFGVGCDELRVAGGRFSGWGRKENHWMKHAQSVLRGPTVTSGSSARGVLLQGCQVGSPRFSANHFNETADRTPQKPWGGNVMGGEQPQATGPIAFLSNSIATSDFRLLADGFGNMAFGPDFTVLRNFVGNSPDDIIEIEGSNPCAWAAHNYGRLEVNRPGDSTRSAFAMTPISNSPIVIERNVYEFVYNGFGITRGPVVYKHGRSPAQQDEDTPMGAALIAHETAFSSLPTSAATEANFEQIASLIKADGEAAAGSILSSFYLGTKTNAPGFPSPSLVNVVADAAPMDADTSVNPYGQPIGSGLVGKAQKVDGVNDGGPYWKAEPDIGALPAP